MDQKYFCIWTLFTQCILMATIVVVEGGGGGGGGGGDYSVEMGGLREKGGFT